MNDLDVVHDFAPDVSLPSASDLSVAREHVVAGIAGRRTFPLQAEAERLERKRRGPARRIAFGGVAVAAAAAVTAGLLLGGGTHAVVTVPAQLTAREVLDRAASAALQQPVVVPRGDQFVYTEVTGGAGSAVVRTWLSVDGTRNGLSTTTLSDGKVSSSTLLGCVNGERTVRTPGIDGKPLRAGKKPVTVQQYERLHGPIPMDGPVITTPCAPQVAYFPDMPTSAGAMLGYLERTQGIRPDNVNDLAKTVGYMLESDYILPAQRAALYEFLAMTPGLIVEPDVRDISGRPGVGVGWSFEGGRAMNIFDPTTYAYLGLTTWGIAGQKGGDALIQVAIVNRPGQLP
jgi:hypothetical protein